MNKIVRDGKAAVIHTTTYGRGWFSWHNSREALYDPELVAWIMDCYPVARLRYFEEKYPDFDSHTLERLDISWVPIGTRFMVQEYDGMEWVVCENEIDWEVA